MRQKCILSSIMSTDVYIQDQTSELVELYLCQLINAVTLASNTTIDTYTFNLVAGHGVVVGNMMCFKEGTHFMQADVLIVATNTITIDRPLDFAFTTAATVNRTTHDMNVNGSVTRQVFEVSPINTTVNFDITSIIFSIEDNSVMDTSLFGGLPALTRGIVLRRTDGTYKTIFNAKSNDDFFHHCDDHIFIDKAPSGYYGFVTTKRFNGQSNNGVALRLNVASGDAIQVIVQDDLTGLTGFEVIVRGHVVVN